MSNHRICTIYRCPLAGAQRCCADCDKCCDNRCLNAPERCGVAGSRPKGKQHTYDHSRIIALAAEGLGAKEIAAEIGCTANTVYQTLREARMNG